MSTMQQLFETVLALQAQYTSNSTAAAMVERRAILTGTLRTSLEAAVGAASAGEFEVEGSSGAGNAAKVPWIRIFNRAKSPSPRNGWYLVYLFAADGSSVTLSLNQGVTELARAEAARRVVSARRALASPIENASRLRVDRLNAAIDLRDRGLGRQYENGHVEGFSYLAGTLPEDATLVEDLVVALGRLERVYELEDTLPAGPPLNDAASRTARSDGLELLAHRISWDRELVLELIESLTDDSPQVVLNGPPGTGKTFVAREVAAHILGMAGQVANNPYLEVVQFHSSYGYEDFVEGLRPVPDENGALQLKAVAGVLVRMVDEMTSDGLPRVLVIDEMNRANLPRVFGELLYLLEYRDQDVRLMYRDSFSLPSNLYIIGTMNTADRSTRNVDLALRRRFDFFSVMPEAGVLQRFYEDPANSNALRSELLEGFEALNASLRADLGSEFQIGHSYFMDRLMDGHRLEHIWRRQLQPLIAEYFDDDPSGSENYQLARFWPNV